MGRRRGFSLEVEWKYCHVAANHMATPRYALGRRIVITFLTEPDGSLPESIAGCSRSFSAPKHVGRPPSAPPGCFISGGVFLRLVSETNLQRSSSVWNWFARETS
jgi:hypothetical protein